MTNEAEHVDVEYVFRYLLYSDAFEFCSSYELKYVRTTILICIRIEKLAFFKKT